MLSGKPYSTEPLRSTLLFCPSSLMPTASPFPLACRPHYMNHWGHMWGILLIGCFELPPNLGGELHIDHTRRLITLCTESGLVTDVYIYISKRCSIGFSINQRAQRTVKISFFSVRWYARYPLLFIDRRLFNYSTRSAHTQRFDSRILFEKAGKKQAPQTPFKLSNASQANPGMRAKP
jgi:hypothetical protein